VAEFQNEIQEIEVRGGSGGGIKLTVKNLANEPFGTSELVPYNATAQAVQDALIAVVEFAPEITQDSFTATGGPLNTAPVSVQYIGDFAGHNYPQMEIDTSELILEDN
jgi:hypothetical protein